MDKCPDCGKDKPARSHLEKHVRDGNLRKVEHFTIVTRFRRDKHGQRMPYSTLRRLVSYEP